LMSLAYNFDQMLFNIINHLGVILVEKSFQTE
jgi:hypothetical protein